LKKVKEEEGKTRFSEFEISNEILCALQDLGFKYCTPVQEKCLPEALEGKDITAKAQTGTGKTAAFLIAAFTTLLKNPLKERKHGACRVLILAPTRELALQIYKDAEAISKYCGFNNLVVFGGMERRKQRDKLADNIEVLVGTPGRIIDFCRSRHLHLHDTEILVIDEADRMLDMGFIPDVRRIVSKLPEAGKRQTMFFSATLTTEITRLVERWLKNPVKIEAETENMVTDLIEQSFFTVSREEKLAMLLWLIENSSIERMLVFGNRKDTNSRLVNKLRRFGVRCEILSGDVPQKKRLRILELFRKGDIKILIATDVAARGIHVDGISHVINYDLPEKAEDYIHRIGRTGRAGATGKSISFVCEYGAYCLGDIEKLLGNNVNCIYPEEEMVVMPARKNNKRNSLSR
jgi:ATP-dependent RNA helicase RhlB